MKKVHKFLLLLLAFALFRCDMPQINFAPNEDAPRKLVVDPNFELGGRLYYQQAGFSFEPYQQAAKDEISLSELDNDIHSICIQNDEFTFCFYGTKTDPRFKSTSDLSDYWVSSFMDKEDEKVVITQAIETSVIANGNEGTVVELIIESEKFMGFTFSGEIIALQISTNQYLIAYGFSNRDHRYNVGAWYTRGQKIFESMVSTVEFIQ